MFDNHYFSYLQEKILESSETLTDSERQTLFGILQDMKKQIAESQNQLLQLGRLQMYDQLKGEMLEQGSVEDALEVTRRRKEEDDKIVEEAQALVTENEVSRDYMFGYPANLYDMDPIERQLRELEATLPYMNNCGDSSPKTRGNYHMDSKEYEQRILNLIYHNLNVSENDYWGYITSGGTEGNFWGIRTGFEIYPNATLYFSSSSHYSVPKYVRLLDDKKNPENNINIFKNEEIETYEDGKINVDVLLERIIQNYNERGEPAIVFLNWGTTVVGAIDDVEYITSTLDELGIPHYVHLDAALLGGIPKNQENAPAIKDLNELGVDSVSISLHKYVGSNMTNGVLLCRSDTLQKKNNLQIEYIGQEDPTYLGSRSMLPLSTYYRTKKLYERTNSKDYLKNIEYFMERADEVGLEYHREDQSNIIIVRICNSDIQKKYQLATFGENNEFAHIILFPYHKKEIIDELIGDLLKIQMRENKKEKVLVK